MRIKFTTIFCAASLFMGLQSQSSLAQCDTASITGNIVVCNGDSTVLSATPSDVWNEVANFGVEAALGVGFSIGNKGYCGLGIGNNVISSFWEYDQTTDSWSQKASFFEGRFSAVGFSVGTKGYVGLGGVFNSNFTISYEKDDFWEFDPVANTWTQKANYPGGIRRSASGFGIGTKGYVGGGVEDDSNNQSSVNDYTDFWEYNPANNNWTQRANIPIAVSGKQLTVGNSAYVFAGFGSFLSSLHQYNPNNDTWTNVTNYPGAGITGLSGFVIGNTIYIGFGSDNVNTTNDFWSYNIVSNQWNSVANYSNGSLANAPSFAIGNRGYVCAGVTDFNTSDLTNKVYEYTPEATYSWSTGDSTQSIVVDSAGIYTLNMTFPITGCPASSETFTIVGSPSITFTGNDSICSGTSTIITAGGGGASFVWSTGDSTAAVTLNPTSDTTYYVTAIGTNGCSATDSITVFVSVCSGINELGTNENISLYPNPASNLVKVSAKGALLETIKIYNLAGALVYEQAASKSEEVLNINIPSGVYYMHLKTDAGTNIKKFVVQ